MKAVAWGRFVTDEGVPVTMMRTGQRVRFIDDAGQQHGPEQDNVAPALAFTYAYGWQPVDR